jgi:hypothetical protein
LGTRAGKLTAQFAFAKPGSVRYIYHQGLGGCIAIHADGQHSLGVAKALAEARIQRNGPHLVHADGVLAGALDRQLYLHVWRQVSRGIIFGTDVDGVVAVPRITITGIASRSCLRA